jgi:hypothetical protein
VEADAVAGRKKTEPRVITQALIESLLWYDFDTGLFWWYPRAGIKLYGVEYVAHRLAWFYFFGVWPESELDHVNRIRDDNRLENLREATPSQNNKNTVLKNSSGFRGATKYFNKWQSQIVVNGKKLYLGLYDTPEKAHAAYCEAAQKHHGQFWNPGY